MNHRIRLNDEEIELIVSSLLARRAMVKTPDRLRLIVRLVDRLREGRPGNPDWVFGEPLRPTGLPSYSLGWTAASREPVQ